MKIKALFYFLNKKRYGDLVRDPRHSFVTLLADLGAHSNQQA